MAANTIFHIRCCQTKAAKPLKPLGLGTQENDGREYEGILRSSFLIDEHGKIEKVYAKVKTKTHGADVLADL